MTWDSPTHAEGAMRSHQYTITARQVQRHTETLLARHLALPDHGPKCTASVLYAVICWGCRWTVALRPVYQGDAWEAIVRDLLRQAVRAGVKARLVLVDRGFYSVAVIRYLQAARYPFILPVVRRGLSPKHPNGPSGTWTFFTWKRSGWSQYTLTERRGRQRATVSIGVCCRWVRRRRRRRPGWGPRQREVWVYAFWGVKPSSMTWLRATY